jgi:uncharacterized protein (DUF2236 family)
MARLPGILQNQIEALAAQLLAPPGVPRPDFAAPPGEPALLPPDSVSWRVFDNPVTLFIGGIAAVLLELAEPRIRHGVWDHSDFRTNPLARMQRTGLAALVTVYAPHNQARAMIAAVTRAHGSVTGTTSAGEAYSASDPDLLDWVGATALYGFMEAYSRYDRPLSPADRDRCFAEGRVTAGLYGATGAPDSVAGWDALLDRMRPRLEPSETLLEFLAIMRRVPALPAGARPLQHVLIRAAVDILPPGIAAQLRIADRGLRPLERPLVHTAARTAGAILIRNWPSVAACRRLGLADDWLLRRD